MSETAINRLKEERKEWRKNHPFGFVAKPKKRLDGSLNYMVWECVVPGVVNTPWQNANYHFFLIFNDDYPLTPPQCRFEPTIFHPNVNDSGLLCTELFNQNGYYWSPDLNISYILCVIQQLLAEPDVVDVVNEEAFAMYCVPGRNQYNKFVNLQAKVIALQDRQN